MKRILLVFCVLIGIQSNAQICTPDTATPSMAAIGYPSLEWSGLWVNGETPSFACDSATCADLDVGRYCPLIERLMRLGRLGPFSCTALSSKLEGWARKKPHTFVRGFL